MCRPEENLRLQYQVLGMPSYDGIDRLLRLVGLADTGAKKVKHFSLGMRQRLGIAVALAGDPDFLVLDEPTNGLDPQGIIELRELILKLNREQGITVLLSSHILDELSRVSTWYGFLDQGRMVRQMSAQELEAACRKCVRVTVSDTTVLARGAGCAGCGVSNPLGHSGRPFCPGERHPADPGAGTGALRGAHHDGTGGVVGRLLLGAVGR